MTVAVCDTPSDQKDRRLPGPQAAAATAQWRCEALRPHRSGRRLYCMREAGTAIRQGIHALPAIRTRAERLYASLALRLPTASVSVWCARRSQREAGAPPGRACLTLLAASIASWRREVTRERRAQRPAITQTLTSGTRTRSRCAAAPGTRSRRPACCRLAARRRWTAPASSAVPLPTRAARSSRPRGRH